MVRAYANFATVVALAGTALACSRIAGIDDYSVGSPPIENPCDALHVPTTEGCKPVGVDPAQCGEGFAPDGNGGCDPVLPATPCPPGQAALPGNAGCGTMTVSSCEYIGGFGIIKEAIGTSLYVDPAAAGTGDGSMEKPFNTIAAALDAVKGDVSLALAAGTFTERVVVSKRRVQIVGPCYGDTTIAGPAGSGGAVITLGPGADGSRVERVAITGGTRGVSVSSSNDVEIEEVWVHDVEGRGIAFEPPDDIVERIRDGEASAEDADGPLSGSVKHSLVENARDAGISAHGADLSILETVVRNTRTREDGDGGVGIFAGAGALYPSLDLKSWRASHLTIDRCVIQGNHEAGLLVNWGWVSMTETAVLDTQPDRDGQGRGIRMVGSTGSLINDGFAASLELSRSVVARSHDVGVSLWNADATLTDTVVRDVGEGQGARCLGNGVRARYDLVPAIATGVRVSRSLIERTRQAAVHLEGGASTIDGTIVRETGEEPCRGGFGDGVALYESAAEGSVVVTRSRIEKSARAAVARFGGNVTLDAALLDCNARSLAGPPPAFSAGGTLAGCGGGWQPAAAKDDGVERALVGGQGCPSPDGTLCMSERLGVLGGTAASATLWVADHDEIASVLADAQGNAEISGLPAGASLNLQAAKADAITAIIPRVIGPQSNVFAADADSPAALYNFMWPLSIGGSTEPVFGVKFDVRRASLNLWLLEATPDGCGVDLQGYTAKLTPGPFVGPLYGNEQQFPDNTLASAAGSTVYFVDVAPGEHDVTFYPPDGKSMTCSHLNPFTSNWGAAWPSSTANSVRVRVAPATMVQVISVWCTVDPPSHCPPPGP